MTDIIHEITVNAPADTVFDAIATEAGLKGWWTTDARASGRMGGTASFGFYKKKMTLDMRYDALERGKRLQWSVTGGPDVWRGTAVSFDLEPAEEGATKVRFRNSGWKTPDGIYPAMINTGWGGLMYHLKKYAESGKSAPMFQE